MDATALSLEAQLNNERQRCAALEAAQRDLEAACQEALDDAKRSFLEAIRIKPDFTEDEFGFTALERIWNRVHALQGAAIALDGEEFRADPHAIAYKLCVWSDVRYSPDMLTWEDGRIRDWAPHEELSQAKWHETLEKSRRILPPAAETPVRVDPAHREMVTRAQEIYRRLTADRIRPDPI